MRIDVHHYYHADTAVGAALDRIKEVIEGMGAAIQNAIQELVAAVAENTAVDTGAIQLIQGLCDKLEAVVDDPDAILAVIDEVRKQSADMAAAIEAGTGVLNK